MKKRLFLFIGINICVILTILILYKLSVKGCIFKAIFGVPCPGCGLTRSVDSLLNGNIILSLKYNILTIPLIIAYVSYIYIKIKDIIKNENKFNEIFSKYQAYIVIIIVLLSIASEIKNLFNPLLY